MYHCRIYSGNFVWCVSLFGHDSFSSDTIDDDNDNKAISDS